MPDSQMCKSFIVGMKWKLLCLSSSIMTHGETASQTRKNVGWDFIRRGLIAWMVVARCWLISFEWQVASKHIIREEKLLQEGGEDILIKDFEAHE